MGELDMPTRIVSLVFVVGLVMSFAASGFLMGGVVVMCAGLQSFDSVDVVAEFLFNSPLGVAVQALVDAALIAVL